MRRTGGTTLATLLATLSGHPSVPHEPFNPERIFGAVTRGWHNHHDKARLRAAIIEVLTPRPVIKHCYEILAPQVNRTLMEASTKLGYRHVILDRNAEADRILSLELAKSTGAWGGKTTKQIYHQIETGEHSLNPIDIPHALHHLQYCQKRRLELAGLLEEFGQTAFTVYFEEVYGDPQAGRDRVGQLLEFLGILPNDHADYDKLLSEALLHKGQNSARVMTMVPNIDQARAQLNKKMASLEFRFPPS